MIHGARRRRAHLLGIGCTGFWLVYRLADPRAAHRGPTIDTWWPEINAFIDTGITNARFEGYKRLVRQVKRAACGFRMYITQPAGYDSTAPADSGPQPRLHADCPVKIEEPLIARVLPVRRRRTIT
ncbi:transposase [Mycobacterium paraffinicum]|uniref:Transposase IS204/IS1001/IS1096/IS1165 DDE domain-containing protein n=1 Tax=Mycobacterium paraffinicum TaxID=53378 RepID=A0ABP8F2Q0_9MYCO|nr:transposase [Mycobacterium paraffinicum]